jgi:prepilin-type N-terminal cleavage/methylation domain-containing protein
MKKNNKGFTLIELLAVIVILAILVAVAIPSVTKYLNDARKGSMQNEAAELVTAARTYIVANNITKSGNFVFDIGSKKAYWAPTTGTATPIGNVVQKNLKQSPYGNDYKAAYVKVTRDNSDGASKFELYLSDGIYCFNGVDESELSKDENLLNDSDTVTTCSDMEQATYTVETSTTTESN